MVVAMTLSVVWEKWSKTVRHVAQKHVLRIEYLVQNKYKVEFESFMAEMHRVVHPSVSRQKAIEMVSQYAMTKRIFDGLFHAHPFVAEHPISKALQHLKVLLMDDELRNENQSLHGLFSFITRQLQGVDETSHQRILIAFYDLFFYRTAHAWVVFF